MGSTRCAKPALLAVKGDSCTSLYESKVLGLQKWQACSKGQSSPGFGCEQARWQELSAAISDQERSLQVRVQALCIFLFIINRLTAGALFSSVHALRHLCTQSMVICCVLQARFLKTI